MTEHWRVEALWTAVQGLAAIPIVLWKAVKR
jgi:hypothetical protein